MTTTNQHGSTSRIPHSLQAVFLAANQGQDVHEPPTDGTASKVFAASSKDRRARWPRLARVGNKKNCPNTPQSERRGGRFRWFSRPRRRQPLELRTKQSRSRKSEVDHTEQSSSSETCREADNVDVPLGTKGTQQPPLEKGPPDPEKTKQPVEEKAITAKSKPIPEEKRQTLETKIKLKEATAAVSMVNNSHSDKAGVSNHQLTSPPQPKSPISSRAFYSSSTPPGKSRVQTPPSPQPKTPLSSRAFYGQSPVGVRNCYEDDETISSGDASSEEETSIPDEIRFSAKSQEDKAKRAAREKLDEFSPQTFLDTMLHSRGYSTERFSSLQTGYSNKPTALQQASYGTHLVKCIRSGNKTAVREMMRAALSPNACNAFGESVLHLVCRCGDWQMLFILLSHGASVHTADDFGRTPLHDVCWAPYPSFATVELILQEDVRLLYVTDSRQATPLSYVCRDHWAAWRDFLRENADKYWPPRNVHQDGVEPAPSRALQKADSCPLPDPPSALPVRVAAMVAQGRLQPCEAVLLANEGEEDDDTAEEEEEENEEKTLNQIECGDKGGSVSRCEDSESLDDYVSCDSRETEEGKEEEEEDGDNDKGDDDGNHDVENLAMYHTRRTFVSSWRCLPKNEYHKISHYHSDKSQDETLARG